MKQFLFCAVVVLTLALAAALRYSGSLADDKNRLLENQAALLSTQREYKLRDSLNAVSVGVLTLKADELRRGFGEMEKLVRDMNVKLRRVENISQTALEGRYDITATLKDTLVWTTPKDTLVRTTLNDIPMRTGGEMFPPSAGNALTAGDTLRRARVLRFRDAHMELDGFIMDSVFLGSVLTRDTLTQVLHRIPRRFLFIRWGTKELRQEIVSSNPHSRITYNRTVRIVK